MSRSLLPLAAGLLLQGLAWVLAWQVPATQPWSTVVLSHVASCGLLALAATALLPTRLQRSRSATWAWFATLCLVLPGLGPLALMLGLWRLHRPDTAATEPVPPASLGLPVFDGNLGHATDLRVVGMARRALRTPMPAGRRLQALMSLQGLPSAASNALLREALRDADDEVRLVAYTLMDKQEKALMDDIHGLQKRLDAAPGGTARLPLLRQTIELHLELLHRSLVQGDWRQQLIERALHLCTEALQRDPRSASLHLLQARLQGLQGDQVGAHQGLERALQLGAAPCRTLPYLAEQAYLRGEPARVREWLRQLDPAALSPKMQRLRAFWVSAHD